MCHARRSPLGPLCKEYNQKTYITRISFLPTLCEFLLLGPSAEMIRRWIIYNALRSVTHEIRFLLGEGWGDWLIKHAFCIKAVVIHRCGFYIPLPTPFPHAQSEITYSYLIRGILSLEHCGPAVCSRLPAPISIKTMVCQLITRGDSFYCQTPSKSSHLWQRRQCPFFFPLSLFNTFSHQWWSFQCWLPQARSGGKHEVSSSNVQHCWPCQHWVCPTVIPSPILTLD